MVNQPVVEESSPESHQPSWFEPHRIALIIIWLLVTGVLVVLLAQGVRQTDQFGTLRSLLQAAYVLALLWYLARTGPPIHQLDELPSRVLPRWKYGVWVPVAGIALLLVLVALSDDAMFLLLLLLMIATLWILVAWRREIRMRPLYQGLAAAVVAYLGGLPALKNGFIGMTTFYGLLVFVPLMYVAGGLLIQRTGLAGIQLLAGRYAGALRSFLWGCLLFVPLGLINAAEGSPGMDIPWVTHWWMPLSLPFFSGIAEEAWFRLLLVGLGYFLLRPAFRTHPAAAVLAAVLFSGIVFGLGHGRTLDTFLTTGLLYGVPLAVVFARRDWEHAIGAHYMINMIPWAMVFLQNWYTL
ncbi:MAG: CPBP family intramembrane metalloprotease [Fidelibacterota bacterium]|nr:MAG: CPBP family intramembrane metalloprotease [Candidatus Neomarinimicrobiota bacterium]